VITSQQTVATTWTQTSADANADYLSAMVVFKARLS
jgi:hypothetical protein